MSNDESIAEQNTPCAACGADNRQTARFCRQCGSKLGTEFATQPPQEAFAPSLAPPPADHEPEGSSGQRDRASSADEHSDSAKIPLLQKIRSLSPVLRRPIFIIPAAIIGMAVIAIIAFLLIGPVEDMFAPSVKQYANRDAQVTSSTNSSAIVLGNLQRGDAIVGKWVKAPGGQARWLKVTWPVQGSGYIWGPYLSDRARPNITLAGPVYPAATVSTVVYAEPDPQSAVIDDLSKGETASLIGATSDGWAEIALNFGGVGYVRTSTLQGFQGASNDANVDVSPEQISALSGITHYTCSFSPNDSKDPPTGATSLSFYLDEGRACIDHRYAYMTDETGGLKRVMLNDKDRRASLLYFMQDRKTFYRTDFTLSSDDYKKLVETSAALESVICSPPADPTAATALRALLKRVTPTLDVQTHGVVWQRRVWKCSAEH